MSNSILENEVIQNLVDKNIKLEKDLLDMITENMSIGFGQKQAKIWADSILDQVYNYLMEKAGSYCSCHNVDDFCEKHAMTYAAHLIKDNKDEIVK